MVVRIGPHRLIRNGKIRRCSLVGVDMTLLDFEVSSVQTRLRDSFFLLLADPDVVHSASPPAQCLPTCSTTCIHDNNELNLLTVS